MRYPLKTKMNLFASPWGWLLLTGVFSSPAWAQPAAGPTRTVSVLVPEHDEEQLLVLTTALEAHLGDLSAIIHSRQIPALPETSKEQVELARTSFLGSNTCATIWIDRRQGMIFILINCRPGPLDDSNYQLIQRALPQSDDQWAADCDAIALMVRSALTPWLDGSIDLDPRIEPLPEARPAVETSSPPVSKLLISDVYFAGAYTPVWASGNESLQHGGYTEIGWVYGNHVNTNLGFGLLSPLTYQAPDVDDELRRYTFRFGLGGFLSFGQLDCGLKANVLLDLLKSRSKQTNTPTAEKLRFNPGISSMISFRFPVSDLVVLWGEAGADFYVTSYHFARTFGPAKYNDEVVIRYGHLQPRLLIGVAFFV